MQDTLSISEQGLRLIKAFEGFRPVDRELVSGRRVVGYGHRLDGDRAVTMTEAEASAQLMDDLAPFEDMLNSEVYASLTQGQFDAMASLAFNIGPKAFRDSDVLRAVNSGRPLDAARGFDAWRLAKVGGETYVIDALVRRRTAEKALFLRPPSEALAPKAPTPDLDVSAGEVADDPQPVLDRDGAGRLVSDAPYDIERLITAVPARRVDDRPAGQLADSELPDPDLPASQPTGESTLFAGLDSVLQADIEVDGDNILDLGEYADPDVADTLDAPLDTVKGPIRTAIADAADEVRDRLEALMEPGPTDMADDTATTPEEEWPDSLITGVEAAPEPEPSPARIDESEPASAEVVAFPRPDFPPRIPVVPPSDVIDGDEPSPVYRELPTEYDTSADLVPNGDDLPSEDVWVPPAPEAKRRREAPWPYLVFLVIGGALFGTGAALYLRETDRVFGLDAQLAAIGLLMVGGLVLLGGLLYLVKGLLNVSES